MQLVVSLCRGVARRCQMMLSDDGGADGVDDVADMVVRDPRTGGKADADAEQRLAHAVGVGGGVAVDRLTVHRFPQRARLYAGRVEGHAQGFDIVVGLAVGRGRFYGVRDALSNLLTYGSKGNQVTAKDRAAAKASYAALQQEIMADYTDMKAAVAAADTLEAKQAAATNASNAMSQKVYNTTLKMYNKLQAKTAARAWVSSLLH